MTTATPWCGPGGVVIGGLLAVLLAELPSQQFPQYPRDSERVFYKTM